MLPAKPSILCTGPVDLSLLPAGDLENVTIDVVNFTEISTGIPGPVQEEIKNLINEKAVAVFTSSNALRSLAPLLTNQQPGWTVFCLGNTTCELARSIFGPGLIRQTATNAASLAKRIVAEKEIKEVIFFCGNLRRNDLPDMLHKNNIRVKEITVYQTALVQKTIDKAYEAVLFFSPSAAESFFSANSLPAKTIVFVIGNTTAEKVRASTNNMVVVSDEPDKLYLIHKTIKSLASPLA